MLIWDGRFVGAVLPTEDEDGPDHVRVTWWVLGIHAWSLEWLGSPPWTDPPDIVCPD